MEVSRGMTAGYNFDADLESSSGASPSRNICRPPIIGRGQSNLLLRFDVLAFEAQSPKLRFVHGDNRAAEMLGAERGPVADDAKLPVVGARNFQQQTLSAVGKLPQPGQRDFARLVGACV